MKRGSSVLQPPSNAAKRHTHPGDDACSLSTPRMADTHTLDTHTLDTHTLDTHTLDTGSSPLLAATSLFSPDVSTKMASDLLIRLSEATQKAQVHPGSRARGAEPERREAEPKGRGGQQDEPGLALSPDGPGASPEPPPPTHTPDGNTHADTLASELLRRLAESRDASVLAVRVKEEEEPLEVDAMVSAGAAPAACRFLTVKMEERAGMTDGRPGAKMADQRGPGGGRQQLRPKTEDDEGAVAPPGKMEDEFLLKANAAEPPLDGARLFSGADVDEQLLFGAKTEEQRLRAALWQDMSVNLASTLLHQLSERVGRSTLDARTASPARTSPGLKLKEETSSPSPHLSPQHPPYGGRSSPAVDPGRRSSFFYRCHVCGFETEGRSLFQSHMSEHRQRERGAFSLHCCACDHATNQEAAMRAHADTHAQGDAAARCPVTPPPAVAGRAPTVATATQQATSTSEHRCRICQRSFPGQQELLVHFQGHRQGNQYRCERCGHLTRTANKLVEHVRVHTGERPFTCDLCPYSAKRRDSLRLHCKVKHAALGGGGPAARTPGAVHTHRSYAHADGQRSNKHVQRLHTNTHALPPLHPSLSELSPLVPITTLLALRPPSQSSSSSSCSLPSPPSKQSFLSYLGLTTSF